MSFFLFTLVGLTLGVGVGVFTGVRRFVVGLWLIFGIFVGYMLFGVL
jgi:hypothetical protein